LALSTHDLSPMEDQGLPNIGAKNICLESQDVWLKPPLVKVKTAYDSGQTKIPLVVDMSGPV
jgi:hypothetical protein